jgi:hypothetical protein
MKGSAKLVLGNQDLGLRHFSLSLVAALLVPLSGGLHGGTVLAAVAAAC